MEFSEILNFLSGPYVFQVLFVLMILCGFGSPLNADLILLFMGTLAGLGELKAIHIIPVAYLGLLVGDSSMFLLGKRYGFRLLKFWPFNKIFRKKKIYQINKFIKKRGPVVVLMARFLPGTRTVTIFSSGVFKMNFYKFFSMDALGLAIMVPFLVLTGKYFISSINEARENLFYISFSMVVLAGVAYITSKKFFRLQF
jgi:membrane protein DedA with SNARE-associated domain